MTKTLKNKVLNRIQGHGRGWAFTPKDFLDLSTRGAVGRALYDLADSGQIRRVARGVYDFPRQNPALGGQLSPDIDQAARAVARKHRWTIAPDPALAANLLGLSQQIPAKTVYLSDGPTKAVKLGPRTVHFKHASPKTMNAESQAGSLAIQALRYLGRERVNPKTIQTLRTALGPDERRRLLSDARYAADWVYETAKIVAKGD